MASTSDPPEKSAKEHPHTTHFHGKEPRDPLAILLNAAKSGTRSAIIAFSARAFLTLLLRLARGRMSAKQARAIFLGDEPRRFAAMFGTFTFLFKALNGLLGRLVMGRPARRVSILTHEEDVPAEKLSLRSPRFLIAAVSGFLAALPALSFEKGEERLGWAQQFFVRGLQCWVVFLARERGVYVPHGDSLVFILSCAQIMWVGTV